MIPTGNRFFWKLQIIGWGLVGVSNFIVQSNIDIPFKVLLFNSIVPFFAGLGVTTTYRFFIYQKKWKHWSVGKMAVMVIGSTFILTVSFLLIIALIYAILFAKNAFSLVTLMSNGFIFSAIMLAWTAIYFGVHYFNHWNQAEVEKWKLVAEMKDAQLGSLKSQINPHFVFNTINNIRALILEDAEKAREMLLNFSDLFRYSLQNTAQAQVTLEEELEMVKQYFELLSIQFEDKLQYKITLGEGLDEVNIPPMMLQLLIENAVKHGISQFKDGGTILVDIHQENNVLNLKVTNTGSLSASAQLSEKLGVGLKNIEKRLELLYNGTASLQLKELDHQVEASIQIPLAQVANLSKSQIPSTKFQ